MVLFDWKLDVRSGGPPGYLGNLRMGLDQLNNTKSGRVYIQRLKASQIAQGGGNDADEAEALARMIAFFDRLDNVQLHGSSVERINELQPSSVHTHVCTDTVGLIHHYDKRGQPRPLIIFTSHCPESWGKEVADIWRLKGFEGPQAARLECATRALEAKAFRESDVWVFPSKEAMEPYYETIPQFGCWTAGKDIRFLRSGVVPLECQLSRDEAKEQFGLAGKKVIAFVGRHIEVKGYDLFKQAGGQMLDEFGDVAVLVAGKLDGLPPPEHARWHELGWFTRPQDVMRAADIFVLPNRRTYFDLVVLEAMSLGATIVASETGGNRTLAADFPGSLRLCKPDAADLAGVLRELIGNDADRMALSRNALLAYETLYKHKIFAQHYLELIGGIRSDYGLSRW